MITWMTVCRWMSDRLWPYQEHPKFNRFLAGLHCLFHWQFCGYGWRFALRLACIYWMPRNRKESQQPEMCGKEGDYRYTTIKQVRK